MSIGIDIDSKLIKALESSTCFGIAHDDTVPECKQCDVKAQCKARCEGANIAIPRGKVPTATTTTTTTESKPATTAPKSQATKPVTTNTTASKPKANASKPAKPKAEPNGNLPNFKDMSWDDLQKLAEERGVEWKDYGNENINRMRVIMSLKKTY